MSLGERIKSARVMARKRLRDLAEAVDVSAMAISKYERDMNVQSSSILIRLARALNVKSNTSSVLQLLRFLYRTIDEKPLFLLGKR